jgi:PAS domain S-box-containing protein
MIKLFRRNIGPEWLMALRVSGLFLLIGSLWILFSDKLVFGLFEDMDQYALLQRWKGLFFVVSVSVLLLLNIKSYLLRNRYLSESLEQSEQRFKEVIEKSISGICITDRCGKFEFVNSEFCKIHGYNEKELLGNTVGMFVDEEVRAKALQLHANVFDNPEERRDTFEVKDKKGEKKTVVVDTLPITWRHGKRRLVTFVTDVTSQMRAETKLRRSENRYRSMMEELDVPLYITDNNCRIIFANKAFRHYFGDFDSTSFCYQKIRGETVRCNWCKDITELKPGEKYEREYFRESDGRIFQTLMIPVEFDPGEIRKMVVMRDLTEILQDKKRAEESDRLKTAFLANMSHEVRTPLNAILGFSSILNDDTLPSEEKSRFVDLIHQSGIQLLNIIDDIVDVARIEQGDLRVSVMPVDINSLLNEVLDIMRLELADGSKPDVELKLLNHLPSGFTCKADPLRLKQVLMNLLGNGIKFTKKGYVLLEAFSNENEIFFNVEDTGVGIPNEKLKIIFERFRQVDESSTRVAGGNGLGLFISKNLVESLDVRSTPGTGSIFSIVMPL